MQTVANRKKVINIMFLRNAKPEFFLNIKKKKIQKFLPNVVVQHTSNNAVDFQIMKTVSFGQKKTIFSFISFEWYESDNNSIQNSIRWQINRK